MKKMWTLLLTALCVLFLLAAPFIIVASQSPKKCTEIKKQYKKNQLFDYRFNEANNLSREQIIRQYEICPPLRSERFRRRVKILWGVDIDDYSTQSGISISNCLSFSIKYQLLHGWDPVLWDSDEIPDAPRLPIEIYSLARRFLFF